MPAYLVVDVEVHDEGTYGRYMDLVPAVADRYGGRHLVRGGNVTPLSGDWRPQRLIILEFASAPALFRFTSSPEYRELAPLRERSTITRSIAVEGIP